MEAVVYRGSHDGVSMIKSLIACSDVNITDNEGWTAMHWTYFNDNLL